VAGRFGRHRNPMMPDDRHENDVMKPLQAGGGLDLGKLGKFPHAVDSNARAGDVNGQMEKPMQIAEPQVQQEEDQVLVFALVCYWLFKKRELDSFSASFFIDYRFCLTVGVSANTKLHM